MTNRKLLMLIRMYGNAMGSAGYYADRDEKDCNDAEKEAARIMKLIRDGIKSREGESTK